MEDIMKQDIKLIAIDLDGTLINNDKILTDYTRETLLTAIDSGVKVVPATGRAISGIPDYLNDIPIEYGIFCNGASVYNIKEMEELYSDRFTREEALTLLSQCEELETIISHAANGSMYSLEEDKPRLAHYNLHPRTQDVVLSTRTFVDNLGEVIQQATKGVDKFVLFFNSQEKKAAAREYFENMGIYHVVSSLYENLEIGKKSCNKGHALKFLTSHLDLMPEQVMSFGDASNDYEMIDFAGTGVAMKNGEDHVKEIANYITLSNDEDGVANAIRKFVL